jgi:hypothetical protein
MRGLRCGAVALWHDVEVLAAVSGESRRARVLRNGSHPPIDCRISYARRHLPLLADTRCAIGNVRVKFILDFVARASSRHSALRTQHFDGLSDRGDFLYKRLAR